MNDEIELCIENLKTLSMIVTLFEDVKTMSAPFSEMTTNLTELNVTLAVVNNAAKSEISKLE